MSEKESRRVRVGCGRYDWHLAKDAAWRANSLTITIRSMESMDAGLLAPVMAWLPRLPYPWCPAATSSARIARAPEFVTAPSTSPHTRDSRQR